MDMIYLDHNATTSTAPEVVEAMNEVLHNEWANPSSIHRMGQMAKRRLEQAREQVADFIGASPEEIIFTGGGTESVNTAIRSCVRERPDRRLVITSQVEMGVAIRMACLDVLTRKARGVPGWGEGEWV